MTCIGIDLGTTNSLVSVWQDDQAILIPNAHNEFLTPSVISEAEDGTILVGKAAKERLVNRPKASVSSFKRRMGTDSLCKLTSNTFRAEELSAIVLKQLKEDAESFLGTRVDEAVISVPAYFNDQQRTATKRAAQLAGLKVERLINEPTAAAIAYGLHERADDCHYLVLDLGGGTFDVSVLEFFEGVMEVHASAGDNFLGGDDFSKAILDALLKDQGLRADKLKANELSLLQKEVDNAKHALSNQDIVYISCNIGKKSISWPLTHKQFEAIAQPLLERIRFPIERALRDAGLRPTDLDEVILVGGSTRMPIIANLARKMLNKEPKCSLNPDQVVCQGAAIQAALKNNDQALQDTVLTDVSPYTLGVETAHETGRNDYQTGLFLPIIERNSIVPVSRVQRVSTLKDGQTKLKVAVYQGESRLVSNNIYLGELVVDVPKGKAGEQSLDIRFTYDVNGILEVLVKIVSTGEERRTIIQNTSNQMSVEEIEQSLQKLDALKVHPREQAENMAILARAERLYEEFLGDTRDYLAHLIHQFQQIQETQDIELTNQKREELAALLDQIEEQGSL
jgi:molecular chaperone HscC